MSDPRDIPDSPASVPAELAASSTIRWDGGLTDDRNVGTSTSTIAPHRELGRFVLQRQLGAGAFGAVYLAFDPQLRRMLAIKVPKAGSLGSDVDVERFFREARAAAQLQHPNIVPVFEAGRAGDDYFIASAFVEGSTLRQQTAAGAPLSMRQIAELLRTLAVALHFAHNKGIIHRDIKPENIMVRTDGEPQIMDFGLARREDEAGGPLQTQDGTRMGTPAYMSPEQASGKSHLADARSDLWSLGVVFYELLTGRRPFAGGIVEVLQAILESDPVPPRTIAPTVPRDLETICLRCLAKDPDHRYPSAQHLADDLQRWLEHRPIHARRAGPWTRIAKWARRNPLAAGVLAVALGASLSWLTYQQTRPGYLDLRVSPAESQVTLGGELLQLKEGRVLATRRPGRYVIEARAADYANQRQEVTLIRGRDNAATITMELRSVFGYVEADTEPTGATVELRRTDGEVVARGMTPFRSSAIPAGPYALAFARDMYLPIESSVEVPAGLRTVTAPPATLKLAIEGAHSMESLNDLQKQLARVLESSEVTIRSGTPLRDAVTVVSKEFGTPIVLDEQDLSKAGVKSDVPVKTTIDLAGKSLDRALQLLLSSVQLMALPTQTSKQSFLFRVVSSRKPSQELVRTLHPVGDLVRGPFGMDGDQLVRLVMLDVSPSSWHTVGGPGVVSYVQVAQCIDVSQTWNIQFAVSDLLADLRRARAANARLLLETPETMPTSAVVRRDSRNATEVALTPITPAIGSIITGKPGTWGVRFHNSPVEPLTAEPQYASEDVSYGALVLGSAPDKTFVFAMDASGQALYVDRNNDEALTDDEKVPLRLQGQVMAAEFDVEVQYSTRSIAYRVGWQRDQKTPEFYVLHSDTARGGELVLDNKSYKLAVLDFNCDGRFDDLASGLLLIDLDRDGRFDDYSLSAELYNLADHVNVNGTTIEISSVSEDGLSMQIRVADKAVAAKAILKPGHEAPDFAGTDLVEQPFALKDVRGKPVLLYFWSSQWPAFTTQAANVRQVLEKFPTEKLAIVGVCLDGRDPNKAGRSQPSAVANTQKLAHRHLAGASNPVVATYRARPSSPAILIDPEGKIVELLDLFEVAPASSAPQSRTPQFMQAIERHVTRSDP